MIARHPERLKPKIRRKFEIDCISQLIGQKAVYIREHCEHTGEQRKTRLCRRDDHKEEARLVVTVVSVASGRIVVRFGGDGEGDVVTLYGGFHTGYCRKSNRYNPFVEYLEMDEDRIRKEKLDTELNPAVLRDWLSQARASQLKSSKKRKRK